MRHPKPVASASLSSTEFPPVIPARQSPLGRQELPNVAHAKAIQIAASSQVGPIPAPHMYIWRKPKEASGS